MSAKVVRCSRCQRRCRNNAGWNIVFSKGFATGHLCPDCQSPEENAEAEINLATIDYGRAYNDAAGRLLAPAKGVRS